MVNEQRANATNLWKCLLGEVYDGIEKADQKIQMIGKHISNAYLPAEDIIIFDENWMKKLHQQMQKSVRSPTKMSTIFNSIYNKYYKLNVEMRKLKESNSTCEDKFIGQIFRKEYNKTNKFLVKLLKKNKK